MTYAERQVLRMLLWANNVSKSFGGIAAVKNVSAEFYENEIVGIIGSNGAGKTTLFNILTGFIHPDEGEILYGVKDRSVHIEKMPPFRLARMGIGRTFQNIRLFTNVSVLQNVEISLRACGKDVSEAERILRRVLLYEKKDRMAGELTYGEQKNLELARCFATMGKIIFLDEPAAGLNSGERQALVDIIKAMQSERKLTVVMIEHDMHFVARCCRRVYAMDQGEVIACGETLSTLRQPQVIKAMLGDETVAAGG